MPSLQHVKDGGEDMKTAESLLYKTCDCQGKERRASTMVRCRSWKSKESIVLFERRKILVQRKLKRRGN